MASIFHNHAFDPDALIGERFFIKLPIQEDEMPGRDMNVVRATNESRKEAAKAEFDYVELWLPKELGNKIRSNEHVGITVPIEVLAKLWDMVKAELPPRFDIHEGMVYEYPARDGGRVNRYEIVRLGEIHAIIRRLNSNQAGPLGSKVATTRENIEKDLTTGTAILVMEDEEERVTGLVTEDRLNMFKAIDQGI